MFSNILALSVAPQGAVVYDSGEQSAYTDLGVKFLSIRCIESPLTVSPWTWKHRLVGGCFPGSPLLTQEYKVFSSFPGEYWRWENSEADNMWTTHGSHPGGKRSRKNTILEKITEEIRAGRKMTQKKKRKEGCGEKKGARER